MVIFSSYPELQSLKANFYKKTTTRRTESNEQVNESNR